MDPSLSQYLTFSIALLSAAVIAAVGTPLFARLAMRSGLVVQPRADRWHQRPTPLLGGAGMALGVLVALALVLPIHQGTIVVLVCAGAAFALGLVDDFRHLAPTTKLGGQVLVASALAFGGVHVEIVEFAPVAFVATVFWIVALMNAVNLLDNMDGLAAGVTAIAAAVLGWSALPENPVAGAIAGATAGAALGFLIHNFSPARVFMGDAGSLLLGFLLGTVALLHTASGAANAGLAILGPLVVLAVPIFDTALVAVSRRLAGRPVSRGGRDHVSHRLAALGLSDRTAVLVLYAVAASLAGVGFLLESLSTLVAPAIALAAVALVLFGVFLSEVDVYGTGSSTRPDATASALVQRFATYGRFGLEVGLDVALLTTAYYVSYALRYEGLPQSAWYRLFAQSLPVVVSVQLAALVLTGVYRTLWRYLTLADTAAILRAITIGTVGAVLGIVLLFRFEEYSRAVLLLDWILASSVIVGARSFLLWLRHAFAPRGAGEGKRVLVVGANDTGALAVRLLTRSEPGRYRVIGLIDDDPGKRYRRVGGIPIVGTSDDLAALIERHGVQVVALTEADDDRRARVLRTCERLGVECRDFLVPV